MLSRFIPRSIDAELVCAAVTALKIVTSGTGAYAAEAPSIEAAANTVEVGWSEPRLCQLESRLGDAGNEYRLHLPNGSYTSWDTSFRTPELATKSLLNRLGQAC